MMTLDEPTSIRFTEPTVTAAKRIAAGEGKALGQWIREIVSREIARREGNCPTCGQPRSREGGKAPPAPG
jgi:hypothetical protein